MPSRKPRYVISLQITQGLSPALTFTVTGSKADRILDLLRSDIEKHKTNTQPKTASTKSYHTSKKNVARQKC